MKIFIGCSSRNDIPEIYFNDCNNFLNELFKDNDLVFGAFYGGLMGLSHDITLNNKNEVIGVCPESYKHDFSNLKCTEEIVTKSINKRTEKAFEICDAILFLPGGIGTIYELFVALECKRNHEFDKPIIIYNCNGFFDKLLDFMEVIYNEKFAYLKDKELYLVSNDIDEIKKYINNYGII